MADRWGVRRILIISGFVEIVQVIVFISSQTFWQFQIALVLSGVVVALQSGSINALMTLTLRDELGSEAKDERDKWFRRFQRHQLVTNGLCTAMASIVGGLVATEFGLFVPFVCRLGFVIWLPIIAWQFKDPVTRVGPPPALDAMRKSARMLLIDRPDVRWVIVLDVLLYAVLLCGFWLFQPRLIEVGVPLALFGVVMAVRQALPSAFRVIVKKAQALPATKAWTIPFSALTIGIAFAGLPIGMLGVIIAVLGMSVGTACRAALTNSYLHESLEDDSRRTTELSVVNALELLVFAATIPLWGWLKDLTSAQTAYLLLSATCAVVGGIALLRLRRAQRLI